MPHGKNASLHAALSFSRFIAALGFLPLASYGTIVTTTTDEDNGTVGNGNGGSGVSLREAVKYSSPGASITFSPSLSGLVLRLTAGPLSVGRSLTIDGSALAVHITLSGDKTGNGKTSDDTRVITITSGTVVLDSLIISGGYSTTGAAGVDITAGTVTLKNSSVSGNSGSGIRCQSDLTIQNSTISGNIGGYGGYGGAIYCSSPLTIQNSIIAGNTATYDGGAIYVTGALTVIIEHSVLSGNSAKANGGCIRNNGDLSVRNSVISGNSSAEGGGIYNNVGTLAIESSTFSGNSAGSQGGGIYTSAPLTISNSTFSGNSSVYWGGGIYDNSNALSIYGSTFHGNSAGIGGGISGGSNSYLGMTLINSTVFGNFASTYGGGISGYSGKPTLQNSIIAGNSAPSVPQVSNYYNGSNNITSGAPRLASLGNYGGPTQTMPPLPGSPAIDTGGTTTLTTDQRGLSRVGTPDIGAAEYQGISDLALFWNLDPDGDGIPFGVEQAVGSDNFTANSNVLSGPSFRGVDGVLTLTFGLNPTATPGTRWILRRSTDLSSGSFQEIYNFDGTNETAAPGFEFIRTPTYVTVTDDNPPAGCAFYRLDAELEP